RDRGRREHRAAPEPNGKHVEQVPPVPGDEPEPAVAVVAPAHADLLDPVAAAPRQVQDLDVEHVAVDALAAEQIAGEVALEALEPALGGGNVVEPEEGADEDAERRGAEPAVERLGVLDLRFGQAARADDEVVAVVEPGEDLVQLLDRGLVVGIDEADNLAPGDHHALANPPPLAAAC